MSRLVAGRAHGFAVCVWGVAVVGGLLLVLSDARGFAGARVVGRWLCIAIFDGGKMLL